MSGCYPYSDVLACLVEASPQEARTENPIELYSMQYCLIDDAAVAMGTDNLCG